MDARLLTILERQYQIRLGKFLKRISYTKEHTGHAATFDKYGLMVTCLACKEDFLDMKLFGMAEEDQDEFEPLKHDNESDGAPCDICGSIERILVNDLTVCRRCNNTPHVYDFQYGQAKIPFIPKWMDEGPKWD
mgnify:FL=1